MALAPYVDEVYAIGVVELGGIFLDAYV